MDVVASSCKRSSSVITKQSAPCSPIHWSKARESAEVRPGGAKTMTGRPRSTRAAGPVRLGECQASPGEVAVGQSDRPFTLDDRTPHEVIVPLGQPCWSDGVGN